ncbi:hypothetical protein [Spongiimicrobium salis]|uniref:hypothetical protein n=1 Tax=Spongiimicrobium salis TaxID=1667022 RepID=UPI00374CD4CE
MAIILKNNLDGLVTYATNVPAGSGYVKPNGQSTSMPQGTNLIHWTVETDAPVGSFRTNGVIKAEDGHVYTIDVSKTPI